MNNQWQDKEFDLEAMNEAVRAAFLELQAKAQAFDWIAENCCVEVTGDYDYYCSGLLVRPSSGGDLDEPMTLLDWVNKERGE